MESPEISAQKVYIGPTIPLKLDMSALTLNKLLPFNGTLACVGPAFFGATPQLGFARAVVQMGPGIPPFVSAVPGLTLEVTGGTHLMGYLNAFGLSNMIGVSNNIGVHNGVGLKNMLGFHNRIGKQTAVGGETSAEPKKFCAAPVMTLTSIKGTLRGFWTYNGTPLALLHSHSDRNLKKNIQPILSPLAKVLALKGVTFEWDHFNLAKNSPGTKMGLIAQDTEKVVPEVVINTTIDSKGESVPVKGIQYENLVGLLVEAIKEQNKRIDHLEQCIVTLQAEKSTSTES
tara:strand:+ start:13844 stop:14704 length:861 start_codon:yes stop_codon:yes gene_type:complete